MSIQILHADRIPPTGCLVIPGRVGTHELPQLEKLFAGRRITWLIEEKSKLDPTTQATLERSGAAAAFADDDDAVAVGEQLRPALENGGVIIYIPGRAVARKAIPCIIPGKTLRTLCSFGLPVLPVLVDYPRDACLSIERPGSMPQVVIGVAALLPPKEASPATYRERLLELVEESFSRRPLLKSSLGMALLQGLKKHSRNKVHDGSDDSSIGFDRILGAALVFSKYLKESTDNPRIGIILPPGKAGLIANLAAVFAGKTPVNFNFTAGHEAVRSAMRQAKLDRYVTADPFVRKLASFPWPPNRDMIFIERALPTLKKKIITWTILGKLLPSSVIAPLFGIGKRRNNDEAILLFTSGSSGEPKGVPLTHRNVLGNVCQFGTRLDLVPGSSAILGCLPLFHSFGCTVTLWYPIIEGIDLVTYPNPLETKRLAELIAQKGVNVLLATPTFLRGYMKRVEPEQLRSLQLVVTGAEKLPENLAQSFDERFGIPPQEGYGLTETSPATNVNLPDLAPAGESIVIPSSRRGSVGQLLPGIALRLTDPATEKPQPADKQGVIWLKGANIFPGYLNNTKKSEEVLTKDGWFRTGDVGRIDDDGFLYIEGRISRFSKIAGEMVPHETVEAAINKALGLDAEAERKIAIVGIPDEAKGEAIVLLSTIAGPALEQECIDLRYKLMDAGFPSLWCPKIIVPVEEIPVLASGKLDLKGCEELARG